MKMGRITWTCHVCGRERNDDEIFVYSEKSTGRFDSQVNVRYCYDSADCYQGAIEKAKEWLAPFNKP